MISCDCAANHARKRIVLTGGPGSGKTAVLELIRIFFCRHVVRLREAAGIVFGGGFPRSAEVPARQAGQRAIFHVQRELECVADAQNAAVVLCDRGTVDGAAYWLGESDLFSSVGTTLEAELRRYDSVIHLRTPSADNGYDHTNPLRTETAREAAVIDERLKRFWSPHPRVHEVPATQDFLTKATRALALLRAEVPTCCRTGLVDFPWNHQM
ncbi:MAG: ATP-binding protein [Gemmatimonadaceae bacterium]|nr:ATP-binding protein [Gemmatimonadaceae bacterium]